jgi:hypothetical protein
VVLERPAPSGAVAALLLTAACALGLALAFAVWGHTWDDSAITLGYSRVFAATGEIRFGRYGERVEGFSTLLWMLVGAGLARLFPAPAALLDAARVACGALYVLNTFLFHRLAARLIPARHATAAAIAFALLAVSIVSVPDAMENHLFLTLHLALAHAYLSAFDRAGSAALGGLVLLPPLLFLCRPEGVVTAAALVAALVVERAQLAPSARRRVAAALASSAVLGLAVVVWRHAYFGTWAPNSVYAKTWPPYFQPLSFRVVSGLAANGRFALAAFAWLLPAFLLQPRPSGKATVAVATHRRPRFFGLCVGLYAVYHLATGSPRGTANRVFLAVIPFALLLAFDAVRRLPRLASGRIAVCAAAFVATQAFFYREYRQAPITVAQVRGLLEPAVRLAAITGRRPLRLAGPDMGATLLYWGLDVDLVDTALLNNAMAARTGWRAAADTIFAAGEPQVIETHSPWTELNGLADDVRVAKHYLRVSVDGRFYLVERGFLEGVLVAAPQTGVAVTPADRLSRDERDRLKETVFTDFPAGASGLTSSWRWALELPR